MAKKSTTIEKEGFMFETHSVAVDKGKTKIGTVEVFAPRSIEDLAEGIAKGLETEVRAMTLYTTAKAVVLQAQMRAAKKGGKVPEGDIARLYATITPQQHQQFGKTGNAWKATMEYVVAEYRKEQDVT